LQAPRPSKSPELPLIVIDVKDAWKGNGTVAPEGADADGVEYGKKREEALNARDLEITIATAKAVDRGSQNRIQLGLVETHHLASGSQVSWPIRAGQKNMYRLSQMFRERLRFF
jgi:hypothetical protein